MSTISSQEIISIIKGEIEDFDAHAGETRETGTVIWVGDGIAIVYGIVFHFITKVEVNYYFLAVYGILGGVITEVGDLAFSYVKRNRKIKDFGHIFPGHGGVLDRFDSVIFCAPLIELLIGWLPAFK